MNKKELSDKCMHVRVEAADGQDNPNESLLVNCKKCDTIILVDRDRYRRLGTTNFYVLDQEYYMKNGAE